MRLQLTDSNQVLTQAAFESASPMDPVAVTRNNVRSQFCASLWACYTYAVAHPGFPALSDADMTALTLSVLSNAAGLARLSSFDVAGGYTVPITPDVAQYWHQGWLHNTGPMYVYVPPVPPLPTNQPSLLERVLALLESGK